MKYRIFIDGSVGTTGLQVRARLSKHPYIDLVEIEPSLRKNFEEKLKCAKSADLTILCLPDKAAKETIAYFSEHNIRIIDASSAHRTNVDWTYGFSELTFGHKDKIKKAKLVSNPGCYPMGFLSLTRPLIENGILPIDSLIHVHGVSGYSGGGNDLIDKFENGSLNNFYTYGLDLDHKHNKEMHLYSGLSNNPIFIPNIGNFKQGMIIKIPLHIKNLNPKVSPKKIVKIYQKHYEKSRFIKVHPLNDFSQLNENRYLGVDEVKNTNDLDIFTFINYENNQLLLIARLDNLGKGASGNAIQVMNIMLGIDENLVPSP